MTQYFRLRDDITLPGRWHLAELLLPSGGEPLLDTGVPLRDPGPLTATVSRPGRVLDFSLTSFSVPVATKKLADAVIAVAGADLQCIPVAVAGQSAMVVLNSTRVVRCLDEQNSEFIKWTERDHRADLAGQYRQVTKLTLVASAIPADAHFFRIDGWTVALVVSEVVKTAMESVGCLGAKFIELSAVG